MTLAIAGMSVADEAVSPDQANPPVAFDNGLKLLVLPQPNEPLVQVEVFLSLRGAAINGGLAHLVEHLMFESSENCPNGSLRDSLALLTTYNNAATSSRNIRSTSRCLPALLPRLLAVEADRFGRLSPSTDGLEQERHRVLGEQDFRNELSLSLSLGLSAISMAYATKAEGDPLLGSAAAIQAVTLEDIHRFLTRWFRPDRMVVLISGPVDPDQVIAATKATFGTIDVPQPAPALGELPTAPAGRRLITTSDRSHDLLVVGFRLPYSTPEDAAVAHLTETIMDRENGYPSLIVFEDEAFLSLHLYGDWSDDHSDSTAADKAIEQFWKETGKVIRRTGNDWLFKRNRNANKEALHERISEPYRRTVWRAQSLADDRELRDLNTLAAMIDTLAQDQITTFFSEQFISPKAFCAFAAGHPSQEDADPLWATDLHLAINPYLVETAKTNNLGFADIDQVLAMAAQTNIGRVQSAELRNGTPVHVLQIPNADDVHMGGVRTFDWQDIDALDQDPGRLIPYHVLVNSQFDRKGANIEPRGDTPGFNTYVNTLMSSMKITANGPVEDFDDIVATVHKRLTVDHFNPWYFRHLETHFEDWAEPYKTHGLFKAYLWQNQILFGSDHPLATWLQPTVESLEDWSLKKANKMHQQVCAAGNTQLLVVGDVPADDVMEALYSGFAWRRDVDAGQYPALRSLENPGQHSGVIDDPDLSVAVFSFMFPARSLETQPVLHPLDLLVLEQLIGTRLRRTIHHAGLDSVNVLPHIQPVAAAAMPTLTLYCQPHDARQVLDAVYLVLEQLKTQPPSQNEEAKARLQLAGPLTEMLTQTDGARDVLLNCGLFGDIPGHLLKDLWQREYGLVSKEAAGLFPLEHHAWVVQGDLGDASLKDLAPEIH